MIALSLRTIRYRWPLFVGAFVALSLGTALIGVTISAMIATGHVQLSGEAIGPVISVTDGAGVHYTIGRDAPDMGGIQTVLALAGVVSGFITVFVVSSTFAFSVALRSRDMGLLRLLGTSRKQIRRMVLGEAVGVSVPAALVGSVLTVLLTPLALAALNRTPLTPVPLQAHVDILALGLAALAGLLIAVLGALSAARKAARAQPSQAMRESIIEAKVMTGGRWVFGFLFLIAGTVMTFLATGANAEIATPLSIFGPMALTIAATSFGPLYLPLLGRLALWPMQSAGVLSARLASSNVYRFRRRTASLIAPTLAIIAIVGILTSILSTTGTTLRASQQQNTKGELVVASATGAPLSQDTLRYLREHVSVKAISAPAALPLVVLRDTGVDRQEALVEDPESLAATTNLRVSEGKLAPLEPTSVVLSKEYAGWYGYHVGSKVKLALFDKRIVTTTVTAVIDMGASTPQIIVSPQLASDLVVPATQATLLLESGVSKTAVADELRQHLQATSTTIMPTEQWLFSVTDEQASLNQLVVLVLVGPASVYALIAITNTLVMAYSQRRREVASMRLLGTSRLQIQAAAFWESLIVILLGGVIAAAIIGLALTVYRIALQNAYGVAVLSLPRTLLAGLLGACLLVTVLVSYFAIRQHLRRSAIGMVSTKD